MIHGKCRSTFSFNWINISISPWCAIKTWTCCSAHANEDFTLWRSFDWLYSKTPFIFPHKTIEIIHLSNQKYSFFFACSLQNILFKKESTDNATATQKNEVDSHVYIYHVLIIPLNMFSLLSCMHWRDLSSFNRRIILFEDVISCERFVNAFSVTTVIMINRQKSFGELAAAAKKERNTNRIEFEGIFEACTWGLKSAKCHFAEKTIDSERTFPAELLKTNFILHLQQQSHVQKTYCFAIVDFYLFCFQPQRKICPQFNSVSFVLLYVMRFDFALEIKQ